MEIVVVADVPEHVPGNGPTARPGSEYGRKSLLGDEAADGLRFRFVRNEDGIGGRAFESPRHHHTFQQIRWTETGAVNFAPGQDIEQGDIAYFPRGAYYGPQVKDKGAQLLLQFGFGDEYPAGGKDWYQKYQSAMRDLATRGTFRDGLYVDADPETGEERVRDAVQALLEERTGKTQTIPPEGYEAPILMHPRAFDYYGAGSGVEIKHLGRFFDQPGPNGDVRLSVVRISDGGTYQLNADRAQVVWSVSAGMSVQGTIYPALTCLYSPRGEEIAISGQNSVEFFVVDLPRLD
ncbi:hypothetical protein [Novosphingobium sp. SG707]|uniref:hypothetical protein n=1 Tax=Novosphingobium sp. SG707 TaxID=2586996 RepID=UPI001445D530|nr:hypothetical protein [Novosphingobium sp. SG707]NKJ00954.1 hypothetical protein [Novosphingobium sp. SG707]